MVFVSESKMMMVIVWYQEVRMCPVMVTVRGMVVEGGWVPVGNRDSSVHQDRQSRWKDPVGKAHPSMQGLHQDS